MQTSPDGGRVELPVADLAAPLEGMPKPFIIQAAGAHKRAEAEQGWHRVVFYNTEVFWQDDSPGLWHMRREHPDWLLEEHRAEPFTYWLMDDSDWQNIRDRYNVEREREDRRREVQARRHQERQERQEEERRANANFWDWKKKFDKGEDDNPWKHL